MNRASSEISSAESAMESTLESVKFMCKHEAEAPGDLWHLAILSFLDNLRNSHLKVNVTTPTYCKDYEQSSVGFALQLLTDLPPFFLFLPPSGLL